LVNVNKNPKFEILNLIIFADFEKLDFRVLNYLKFANPLNPTYMFSNYPWRCSTHTLTVLCSAKKEDSTWIGSMWSENLEKRD